MDRLEILRQIDDLEKVRETASPMQKAEIDEQIRKLGEKLTLPRRAKKVEEIRQKGSEMTYTDVEFLLNQGFTQTEIAKWIGLTRQELSKFIRAHGGEEKEKGEKRKLSKRAKGNIEEGKRLLKETDLSVPQIAEITGCTEANLYYHSSRIRGKRKGKKQNEMKDSGLLESSVNCEVFTPELIEPKTETDRPKNKIASHYEILQNMHDIYQSKNKDYGDSFGKQFAEYGIVSSAIRIEDKFQRFKNLIKNEAEVKDETIEDTLLDMANYCVMTLVELEGLRGEASESRTGRNKK